MILRILFLFCFLFSFQLQAQVDKSEKKSIRIPAKKTNEKKDSLPSDLKIKSKEKTGVDKKISSITLKKPNFDLDKPKDEFSMFENSTLKKAGELFEERWHKKANVSGIKRTMKDQFLGEHRIYAKYVNIVCRDFEAPDGDRVRIIVNDKIILSNLLLTNSYKRFKVDLVDGINKIDFLALNQGESGPNTAELLIYDDLGNLVSSKEWNLLTGVKATIVFVNKKGLADFDKEAKERTKQN
jgi:hypothetical protein